MSVSNTYTNSLAQQSYQPNRWLLFVSTNASCRGGVEAILQSKGRTSSQQQQLPPISNLSISETQIAANDAAATFNNGSSSSSNPFSFLSEPESAPSACAAISSKKPSFKSSSSGKLNVGRLLQSVATQTSASFERGLHSLAKTATKSYSGGVGVFDMLYISSSGTEASTERRANVEGNNAAAVTTRFTLPVIVSGREPQVTLSLFIRSGVLGASSSKPILLATCVVTIPKAAGAPSLPCFQTLLWQPASHVAANLLPPSSVLHVCLMPDNKFPTLCGPGWSLADPTPQAVAMAGSLYNVPLDQSYAYSLPQSSMTAAVPTSPQTLETFLVATERAIESSVVLPIASAFAKLAAQASTNSLKAAQLATERMKYDVVDANVTTDYVHVECHVQYLQLHNHHNATSMNMQQHQQKPPLVSCSWQRPDSIFEVELLAPCTVSTVATNVRTAAGVKFFPRPVHDVNSILPSLRPLLQKYQLGFLLGSLKLSVQVPSDLSQSQQVAPANGAAASGNPFEAIAATGTPLTNVATEPWSLWEGMVPLEPLVQQATGNNQALSIPLYGRDGSPTGCALVVHMSVMRQRGNGIGAANAAATGLQHGLVSLTGLPPLVPLMLDDDGIAIAPDPLQQPQTQQQRLMQLSTMGKFLTSSYMTTHVRAVRTADVQLLQQRCQLFTSAVTEAAAAVATISVASNNQQHINVPSHQDRRPRPFRPSSSRVDLSLAGIPFNVHTVSWSLQVMDSDSNNQLQQPPQGESFFNTTCGAPADHARGFGNIIPAVATTKSVRQMANELDGGDFIVSPVGPVTGGLRRLETKRREIAEIVNKLQSDLITSVAAYFVAARQNKSQQQPPVTHIPPRCNMQQLHDLRRKLIDSVQALHHVTWICAVRRAAVFSQALGIATTSYLASLSEPSQCHSSWPEFWVKHGYLVSFEGLLSAAGKELGMIEDASVAIDMLRMVQVVLVRDDRGSNTSRVPIPGSPYLSWLDLSTSIQQSQRQFVLQIGVSPAYFDQRVPPALKNGTPVRFYSLLFEVGVDIRQWGANAVGSSSKNQADGEKVAPVGLIDDEDDDVGVMDEDELVQLNYEALQKLNAYAYWLSPANSTVSQQRTHPLVETLHQHVVNSAGKINHDILDEAAQLAQQLGGGGVVFCKSGKDRTAMHVTYKQAQFLNRFRERRPSPDPNAVAFVDTTLEDASLIRICGTRLPICEKNVGQAKYAFNALQVKFMPDALKPPMNTLAGFLKGGKVFGGIES
ncbi:hypothetical protein MPSEU_000028600 [Mayamaea pseudoterrestris]|nr:hypothetical protein MPSEU_000028600 [Mayamaea pseudoterrestris]